MDYVADACSVSVIIIFAQDDDGENANELLFMIIYGIRAFFYLKVDRSRDECFIYLFANFAFGGTS
jgi:hypothetical protein